jgi:hypothetical protein
MAGLGRKVFTAGDVLTASDVQNYLQDQTVMVFGGTAARSSAIATPTEGMFAVTTDNDEIDYYNGSAWVSALPVGAWTTWSPVLSNTWLNGNGVWDAKYVQIGKTVHVKAQFVLGTTTTKGASQAVVSLPVTTAAISNTSSPPSYMVCAGANTTLGFALLSTTTTVGLAVMNAAGTYLTRASVTSSVPGLWTTGDTITFSMTYEAA